jgi:putative Mg2+ transporter-C (MgtC) family protein
MLTFEQMFVRFAIALVLGALLGLERELVGKQAAGIRTTMLVTSGATIFTMIGLVLPYIVSAQTNNLADVIARNSGYLGMIGNIVIGIGFLGAGLIIKTDNHPHGVTTAALIWMAAAIGILVGVGLTQFAFAAAVVIAILLYLLRKLNVSETLEKEREARK